MVDISQRPGVYSDLESSWVRRRAAGTGVCGLTAVCAALEPGLYTVTTSGGAGSLFGFGTTAATLCSIALTNGASAVVCSVCEDESGLGDAAARFESLEGIQVLICQDDSLALQQAVLAAAESASAQRRERIAVLGMDNAGVEQLCQRAQVLNSERAVLVGASLEGVAAAAAAAGAICACTDPAQPMIDVDLEGISEPGHYSDSDFDTLVLAGVSPVEAFGGQVQISRAVTTRTNVGGVADSSFRELSTILIADQVIPGIRQVLKNEFYRAKNTARTRSAIRTRVIVELENYMTRELIQQYGDVTVEADGDDPTLCLVSFDFTVAHGLCRVHLTAVITV